MRWVVRVGRDDGELRPWHYIYVYSIESRLLMETQMGAGRDRSDRAQRERVLY